MGIIYNEYGEVLRSYTAKNKDADFESRLFETQLTEDGDTQTVQQFQLSGFESRPPTGTRIIVQWIDGWRISIAEDDGILDQQLSEGDAKLYGQSGGSVVCSILCKNTGQIDIDANTAVNITAPDDVTIKSGDLVVENDVLCDGDVIANASSTPYSMTKHKHQDGNLGYDVLTPLPDSGSSNPKPAGAPSGDASGNLDMGGNNIINVGTVDGKDVSTHTHSGVTAGGDNTGPPN